MAAPSIAVTREQVIEALRDVMDPELHKSIVELNMVKDVAIRDGSVRVEALLTISGCPLRETITNSIKEKVRALPGVDVVDVQLGVMTQEQRQALIGQLRPGPQKQSPLLSPTSATRVLQTPAARVGWASLPSRPTWPSRWPGAGGRSASWMPMSTGSAFPKCSA